MDTSLSSQLYVVLQYHTVWKNTYDEHKVTVTIKINSLLQSCYLFLFSVLCICFEIQF